MREKLRAVTAALIVLSHVVVALTMFTGCAVPQTTTENEFQKTRVELATEQCLERGGMIVMESRGIGRLDKYAQAGWRCVNRTSMRNRVWQ